MAQHSVLVVGGGMAGCAAALAAVREGADTVLIERDGYLGGNATRAMVGPWQSFHAGHDPGSLALPEQVIQGIAQEFVDDLQRIGASSGHHLDPIGFAGSVTPVDSEVLKLYLIRKLTDAGVRIQLNTPVAQQHIGSADCTVDATGCCAFIRLAGGPVREPTEPQPYSWLFTMTQVELDTVRDYQLQNPHEFHSHPQLARLYADDDYTAVSGFFSATAHARESGNLTFNRDRLLFFATPRTGEVLINTTRIPTDSPDIAAEGLRQIDELVSWLPGAIPGFAAARLGRIADAPGQRESWRLRGEYTLSAQEIVNGQRHPESVARGCYPVDIHRSDHGLSATGLGAPGWYDIPLGCLVTARLPNVYCVGRAISADRDGFASARVLPTAMATGEAGGRLAARGEFSKFWEN
jgi:glycine/D-amino acid oxidase-like deaminating enzyme